MENKHGIPDDLLAKIMKEIYSHPRYLELNKKFNDLQKKGRYIEAINVRKFIDKYIDEALARISNRMETVRVPMIEVLNKMSKEKFDETYTKLYEIMFLLDMLEDACLTVNDNMSKYDASIDALDKIREFGESIGNIMRFILSDNDYENQTFAEFADEVVDLFHEKSMAIYRKVQEHKRLSFEKVNNVKNE